MLLICTDASRRDLRALDDCTMDMEFGDGGGDANTFELRMPVASAPEGLTFGSLVYVDGTEYGGIVDDVGSDTTGRIHKAVYGGRTWHGVLEGRVLRPDRGADYLSVSGEANAVLLQLVHRMGLAGLFAVDASDSGIRVGYRFARYVAGYAGLRAMLASAGAKLAMRWDGGKVVLSAMPRRDWSREEFEGRRTPIKIKQASRPINHLVCLGKGELAQRTVIDLYAACSASTRWSAPTTTARPRTPTSSRRGSNASRSCRTRALATCRSCRRTRTSTSATSWEGARAVSGSS